MVKGYTDPSTYTPDPSSVERAHDSAGRLCVVISAVAATVDPVATQRYPVAVFEYPVARWSIRRKQQQHPVESLFESAVATHPVVGKSSRELHLDVITISSWLSADEEKQKMMRRRAGESTDGLALMTSSVTSSDSADGLKEQSQESADSAGRLCVVISAVAATVDPVATQRYPVAVFEYPVARWSIRRKQQQHPVESLFESAVATHPVVGKSSRELQYPVAGIQGAKISSRSDGSAAKQLTTYKEISKLDVNCRA
ncbi:hypothetical protein F511_33360 [Dorcoceras hygrometricum]|uniref:Uncharacterized protein n=1 Tax=Dorcoceras hygrometricum TaxID=472368 RepID=A0A2Z7BNN9_9LAMI|nr:hypothetical protein F511_33360 [Dorcoceras hygrometricum]